MKKYKKVLSLICVCLLFCNLLAVVSLAAGTGTQADPFIITTAEELQNINNNVSAHYKLGANIDLADMDFTPIGNADSGAFSGSFDGNGYKISNLNVFSGKYAGLFGSNEGIIKNVILEDIYVYGTRYIGGVVGQNTEYGTLENCSVLSGLVETEGGLYDSNIGGICGINEGRFVGSFSNNAEIAANVSDVYVYAGGICGSWNTETTTEITNCFNTGNVSALSSCLSSSKSYSGGLVGNAYSVITTTNCYNTGSVSSAAYCSADYSYSPSSSSYSGGLLAYGSATINNSYNTGNVLSSSNSYYSRSSFSGGLVGSTTTAYISNSYNTGDVTTATNTSTNYSYSYIGGLVAFADTVNIISSYNTGNVYSNVIERSRSCSGGLVGYIYTAAYIRSSYNSGCAFSKCIYLSNSGGLVGYGYGTVDISDSYNTGNISATSTASTSSSSYSNCPYAHSGGLVGSGVTSNGQTYISNSYNTGSVSSNSYFLSYAFSGGLSSDYSKSVNESYSLEGCINSLFATGSTGKFLSSNDLKNISSFNEWDFDEVWTIDSNINNGYPVLKTTTSPLSLNISNKVMFTGSSLQLVAYKNGIATNDVTWTVSPGSATVTSRGLVTAGEPGLSTITATDSEGNKANFNTYIITKAASITATDRTITLTNSSIANSSYFTVTGSVSDYVASYQSSDTNIVKVSDNGALTPVKAGTVTITATTLSGLSAKQKVTVDGSATSISLPSTLTVTMGSTKKLTATTSPNPTSSTITWKSSDTTVGTVDNEGNVTGLKSGTTIITATTDNGYSATCTVTVNAPVTEMAFETPSLTLYKGQTYKLKLNINPANTTDTITYSSSSSSKASVSSTGLVTAGTGLTSTGTVTITATSSSGQKAYCNITVKAWPSVLTVVDSNATISEDVITTSTTGIRNIDKLVTVKDGYTIDVTYSHTPDGLNYCGTGTVIDVYDDYGNFVISYTLVVTGDVNGDSICNVLDVNDTERMSTDALTFSAPQAYAANGTTKTTVDVSSYQYVLNKALAE